jgi:hypothetical protein
MTDIEVFEIEEQFNPLEDRELDEAELEQETDYLPPIPDAELSRRVKTVYHSPQERIEKLLVGIPGQQFRILHAVQFCVEPHSCDEIVAEVDRVYPREVSVYDTIQIVQLLERAGALIKQTPAAPVAPNAPAAPVAPNAPAETETTTATGNGEDPNTKSTDGLSAATLTPSGVGEFLVVTPAPPSTYLATPAGLEAVEAHCGRSVAFALLAEDERYLPLYQEIFELTAIEDGCPTQILDDAIDSNPLTENPRRFCGYFLGRLENVGAVRWMDNWIITELGRELLGHELLAADAFKDQR